MRCFVYLLLSLACFHTFAQSEKERLDYSPYAQTYSMISANMKVLASHQCLTQFTYYDLNFVDTRLEDFFKNYLGRQQVREPIFSHNPLSITYTYGKPASANPSYIKLKFNCFSQNGNLIIQSCTITGTAETIIAFFVSYWNMNLDENKAKKGELVVNQLMQDRIALSINPEKKTGKISITNNTIKSIDDYKVFLKNNM